MDATTAVATSATVVGVDLAKSVFQLAVADAAWRVIEQHRLTRSQFERWFVNRSIGVVVMEACGSAHHWARWLNGLGIEVRLLPAAHVRAYVKRNKTDAADACALVEAARCAEIRPVRVKSGRSALGCAHAGARHHGAAGRGDPLAGGAHRAARAGVVGAGAPVGGVARCCCCCRCRVWGLLTATAMVAATSGEVTHFVDARHFASWFGLTPKEHSSGNSRRLGCISKRGDRYLRMLLTHGALAVQGRSNHNKATCALANKLARICYACLRDGEPQSAAHRPEKKLNRTAYALAA